MTILVTGSAGFIGYAVSKKLLEEGNRVIGVDNLNDYYDVDLKESRNAILLAFPQYQFHRGDISDMTFLKEVYSREKIDAVCHLAAQAGVRYSLTHPEAYMQSNIIGFQNILDATKNAGIQTLVYASSSSVYGNNKKIPFEESDNVDHPVSLYAATKKANELMAYTYHHLYGMHCTGLRFFTVYGPYGRPDMAYFSFSRNIIEGRPIAIYNHGKMRRDFTYIDDIVAGILQSLAHAYPYEIINLGNNKPVELLDMIALLEEKLGRKAIREFLPMQAGDVVETYADITRAGQLLDFNPRTSLDEGLTLFVDWYKKHYNVSK